MKSRQTGFTMIELIVVIVILGVLAATALPKFVDMSSDAENAAVQGVAGAATSAMNLNYSGCSLKNNVVTAAGLPVVCAQISTCAGVSGLMQGGVDTVKYTLGPNTTGSDIGSTNGNSAICKVSRVGKPTIYATFTGISAGN